MARWPRMPYTVGPTPGGGGAGGGRSGSTMIRCRSPSASVRKAIPAAPAAWCGGASTSATYGCPRRARAIVRARATSSIAAAEPGEDLAEHSLDLGKLGAVAAEDALDP